MSNKTKCPISGIEEDIPRNVHYAVLDEKNSHIKRLEAAIRALLTNIDIEGLLLHIRKGTTAEGLLETERDAIRAELVAMKEAVRPIADDWKEKHKTCVDIEADMEMGCVVATFEQLDTLVALVEGSK